MLHKDKLTIGHDRQSSTEVKNQDMDHTGEGVASEQSISKLSRNSKGGSANKRKPAKEDRPSSAKSVSSIENKYKSSFIKYTKELKDIQTQSEKLVTLRESMAKMREEMIEKGLRDPPTLPEMPESMMISSSRPPSRSSSPKGKLARQLSSSKNKSLLEETNKKVSNSGILDIIIGELPFLEQSYKNLEQTINTAHEKQTNLETNLDIYKNDVTDILMNIINSNDGKNSDHFLQELQSIKETYELEKNSLMNELSLKDEELRTLKTNMENEQSKKLNLEGTLSATYEQNHELKEKCDRYSHQVEMLQKYQMMSQNSGNQDLSIQNAQLLCEVDGLKAKLGQAQDQYETSTKQIEKFKQELNKLKEEKEEIKNELLQQCQQVYFEKQDQIYSIKRKMDSIVNLKNSMMSTNVTPDEVFNLQVLMKINDPDFLKNEIVSFHKRLQDEEEAKTQLEYNLSAQDNKVYNLQEALSEKTKMLNNMESLIKTLKSKVNRSHELITSLRSDEFNENDEMKIKDDDEIEEDLVEWLAYQNDEVAELQQKLKLSEEKFCMAEERRVRNEERIAKLEIKLSKYAYH